MTQKAHNEIAVINNHHQCVRKEEKRLPRREMRRGRRKDKRSIRKTGNDGKGRAEIQPVAKRKVQQYLVSTSLHFRYPVSLSRTFTRFLITMTYEKNVTGVFTTTQHDSGMLSAYGHTEGEREMHIYELRRRTASHGQMATKRTHL